MCMFRTNHSAPTSPRRLTSLLLVSPSPDGQCPFPRECSAVQCCTVLHSRPYQKAGRAISGSEIHADVRSRPSLHNNTMNNGERRRPEMTCTPPLDAVAFTGLSAPLLFACHYSVGRTICLAPSPRRRPRHSRPLFPLRNSGTHVFRASRKIPSMSINGSGGGDVEFPVPVGGDNSDSEMQKVAKRWQRLRWFLYIAGGSLALFALARSGLIGEGITQVEAFISRVGTVRGAMALFVLNFCTVLFCFPANMAVMISSSAILGAFPAFCALYTSKVTAACCAFLLARGALAPRVGRALQNHPRVAKALASGGKESAFRFVLFTRLSPLPGFALNYLLSLTKIRFRDYALGTAVGIIPSVLNLCLIGAAARDVGSVAAGASRGSTLATVVRFSSLAVMLVVSVLITRSVLRRKEKVDEDPDPTPLLHSNDVENGHANKKELPTSEGTPYLANHG